MIPYLQVIRMLENIQNSIFMKLDKGGTYRSIDEETARGIVRSVIRGHIERIEQQQKGETK
jgi:predicted transcriptional regulator